MIYPKNLEKGYRVGVTATSAGFEAEVDLIRLDNGIKHFENRGYPVKETKNVRTCSQGRSSDGKTRAEQFHDLIRDPEVRVVFAASGGDYLVEMLSYLDFNILKGNPKWVQGYSDTTGLTFTLTTNLDMATIYSNNFSSFGMKNWHKSMENNLRILQGEDILQESFPKFQDGYKPRITGLEEFELEKDVEWRNITPSVENPKDKITLYGRVLGGCLDVLLNLVGTRFDKTNEFVEKYKDDGILWYLESYDLNSEALVRGLWQLKEAGWFRYASGFVFGRPAMFTTHTDTSYDEAVLSVLGERNLPIILDADIGHKPPQVAMMNGALARVEVEGGKGNIIFERR